MDRLGNQSTTHQSIISTKLGFIDAGNVVVGFSQTDLGQHQVSMFAMYGGVICCLWTGAVRITPLLGMMNLKSYKNKRK